MPRTALLYCLSLLVGWTASVAAQEYHTTPGSSASSAGLSERLQAARRSVTNEYAAAPNRRASAEGKAASGADRSSDEAGLYSVLKRRGAPSSESTQAPAALPAAPLKPSEPPRMLDPSQTSTPDSARRMASLPRTPVGSEQPVVEASNQPAELLTSSQMPSIRVTTTGPRAIEFGKSARFELAVVNEGSETAETVRVSIDLPSGVDVTAGAPSIGRVEPTTNGLAKQLVWTLPQVAAGASHKLTLGAVPRENRPFQLTTHWTAAASAASASVEVHHPRLEMQVSGPRDLVYGETGLYTFVVSNPGTGAAHNVVVQLSDKNGSARQELGTLEAGGSTKVTVELSALRPGTMEIRAEATADGDLQTEAIQQVLVRRAELQLEAEGPRLEFAGSTTGYKVRVRNTGNAAAENVMVHVKLPAGASYVGPRSEVKLTTDGITWMVGSLAAGTQREVTLDCQLTQAGDPRFQLEVGADGGLQASMAMITHVEAFADLKLTINDPAGARPIGSEVVYEVHLKNRGTKAAREITVVAQFSDGIEPVQAEGNAAELVPGQVLFQPISQLGAGEEITLKITARASKPGNHRFRAEVKSVEPETRLVSEETTRYYGSELNR